MAAIGSTAEDDASFADIPGIECEDDECGLPIWGRERRRDNGDRQNPPTPDSPTAQEPGRRRGAGMRDRTERPRSAPASRSRVHLVT
eukprot:1966772-Prymnesium_polylepis.1